MICDQSNDDTTVIIGSGNQISQWWIAQSKIVQMEMWWQLNEVLYASVNHGWHILDQFAISDYDMEFARPYMLASLITIATSSRQHSSFCVSRLRIRSEVFPIYPSISLLIQLPNWIDQHTSPECIQCEYSMKAYSLEGQRMRKNKTERESVWRQKWIINHVRKENLCSSKKTVKN